MNDLQGHSRSSERVLFDSRFLVICSKSQVFPQLHVSFTCTRIDPRYKLKCRHLVTNDGREILWVTPFVTWCVFIVSSSRFCCSFDNAKKSFYPTLNAVFCKVGRVASQNVVVELLMFKCVPVQFLYQTHRVQTLSVFRPWKCSALS